MVVGGCIEGADAFCEGFGRDEGDEREDEECFEVA